MFCFKCGEAIPDGSAFCSKCGAALKEAQPTVIYASQKEIESEWQVQQTYASSVGNRNVFALWGVLAVLSFIFMAMNYMSISVDLLYGGSSDTVYSGYYLIKCLGGTARLSGIMVILLIIIDITVMIAAFLGLKGNIVKSSMLSTIMLLQSIGYLIVTIIPYFHMKSLLAEFDPKYSTTSIGEGCYLNILLAIIAIIVYFAVMNKNLNDPSPRVAYTPPKSKKIRQLEDKIALVQRLRDKNLITVEECDQKISELKGER